MCVFKAYTKEHYKRILKEKKLRIKKLDSRKIRSKINFPFVKVLYLYT